MQKFSILDRISVSGSIGTIKHIGPIHIWSDDVIAYGIEWDDAERGRNSGDIDGIHYFTTKIPKAGSFIKATNKNIDVSCSFFGALAKKYLSEQNTEALSERIIFGSKTVQNYGFQKLNEISSHIKSLTVIMLDRQTISCVGTPKDLKFHDDALESIRFDAHTLDLSCALISKWQDVQKIISYFPKLKSLNLNGCRMESLKQSMSVFPCTITHLSLSACYISPRTLMYLNLQNVKKLEVSGNSYNENIFDEWNISLDLEAIDLSFNIFNQIPTSLNIQNLKELILTDNFISSLKRLPVFGSVLKLDLRRNAIISFDEIDLIPDVFPHLVELRINGCPILHEKSAEESAMSLIGRLRCEAHKFKTQRAVSKLNGSDLSESEVSNGELFFISKVRSGQWKISNKGRWNELLMKHNIVETETSNIPYAVNFKDDYKVRLSIRMSEDPNEEIFSRLFLQKNTVLRLKGIIAKHIGKYTLDFSISYYLNDDESYESRSLLQDDIASLQSLGFVQNHRIYISCL